MLIKVLKIAGIISCIIMIAACFMPWVYYADLNKTFTGYYSYNNQYGKPGKFLTLIAVVVLAFTILPKVWAKRTNLFIAALGVGYAIKTYILFTSCYMAYCPEKKAGIYLVMLTSVIMMVSAIFPDMKLKSSTPSTVAQTDGDVNG